MLLGTHDEQWRQVRKEARVRRVTANLAQVHKSGHSVAIVSPSNFGQHCALTSRAELRMF